MPWSSLVGITLSLEMTKVAYQQGHIVLLLFGRYCLFEFEIICAIVKLLEVLKYIGIALFIHAAVENGC